VTIASATAAVRELDQEEARLKALVIRLVGETDQAKKQLEEVQVARKVMQRIHGQPDQPRPDATSSPSDDEQPTRVTIKEAALKALEAVYPKGFQKAGIEAWVQENLGFEINSASLSVMLARLRDDDGAVQNQGNIWLFVPPKQRRAA
jgi:hypothetical protein